MDGFVNRRRESSPFGFGYLFLMSARLGFWSLTFVGMPAVCVAFFGLECLNPAISLVLISSV